MSLYIIKYAGPNNEDLYSLLEANSLADAEDSAEAIGEDGVGSAYPFDFETFNQLNLKIVDKGH